MQLQNVILTTENCRYCLMCRHVGSIEQITHKEAHTPRGWALVIASVQRGLLEWNEETVDLIYTAPDHGNSRASCINDQPLPEAIAAVRAGIVEAKLAPEIVYQLKQRLEKSQSPFEQTKYVPQGTGAPVAPGADALFVGDEALVLWPAALDAALQLLKTVGIEPVLIGNGRSNGYIASSIGLPEIAKQLAEANLQELKTTGASRLFVLGPGDYFTFKQLYDERLGLDWPAGVELVEVTEFLVEQRRSGRLDFAGTSSAAMPYAYIDPTHAVRVPGRHDIPRELLAAVFSAPGKELFWRRERAHPVGSTALQFTQPVLAEKLTRARLEDARKCGAKLIITEDPGTLYQLNQFAADYDLQLMGLFELLAEQSKNLSHK